jgi:hypothetical protein
VDEGGRAEGEHEGVEVDGLPAVVGHRRALLPGA